MKTVLSKLLFVTAVTITSLSAFNLAKSEEITNILINLKVTEYDNVILEKEISLPESCIVKNSNGVTTTFSGFKAICVLEQALENNDIASLQVSDWGWGFSLDSINDIKNTSDWSESWILKQNNNNADVGIYDLILKNNDTLTLIYNSWPQNILDISTPTPTLYLGSSLEIQSLIWDNISFVTNTNSITFYVNNEAITSNNGILNFQPKNTGTFEIYVDNDSALASPKINIDVLEKEPEQEVLATTTIHLQIETFDQKLYNDDFVVTACPNKEDGTENTLNAWCTIQQLANQQNWNIDNSWYGDQVFVNKINNYDGSDGNYWLWYHDNYTPGTTGLNQELLQKNENVNLFYGLSQLKLDVSSSTPATNSTTTIKIEKSSYDESWNEILSNSASSTLYINGEEIFSADGNYELYITTTTPYSIYATKDGNITSAIAVISAKENNTENTNSTGGGSSSNNNVNYTPTSLQITETVNKILNYFKSNQNEDGSVLDGGTSDWVAMSFASNNQYAKDIKNTTSGTSLFDYIYNYDFNGFTDLNLCAGYPRHIMALLASGVDINDSKITDLKNKIIGENCYKNNLYGQDGINDDVFALISLLALNYDSSSPLVTDIKNTILQQEQTYGGFGKNDLTGAVLNSLKYAQEKNLNIDDKIIEKTITYLKNEQNNDGGWKYKNSDLESDILTTSWVISSLESSHENLSNWLNSFGFNPLNPLVELLNKDEYYQGTVNWFGLKHAVPSLLGKSWPIILSPITQPINSISGSIETNITTTAPTSTEEKSTSTPKMVEENMTTTTQKVEILPILLNTPIENIVTTTSAKIVETKIEKKIIPKKLITNKTKEILGEKIVEEKLITTTTEKIDVPQDESQNTEVPFTTNKKVALGLTAVSLLYGLFLLFKIFV